MPADFSEFDTCGSRMELGTLTILAATILTTSASPLVHSEVGTLTFLTTSASPLVHSA